MENSKIKSACDELMLDVLTIVPDGEIKGIVQISHGMAEHKERYIPFMEFLAKNGYVTVIHDHRGHGKSVKSKADLGYFYEENAEYVVEDLHQITTFIKNKYPNQKVILLGHSMGSMIVRKYIKKYDNDIDKLIVCGSPSKNPLVDLALLLVKILKAFKGEHYRSNLVQKLAFGKYGKKFQQSKSENVWICSDNKVVNNYDDDELCGFTFTLNGFSNLFHVMKDIYSKKDWALSHKNLPILFIAGADDQVIINEKKWLESQEFLKNLGYENIEKILYPNMRHEILNEINKDVVWKDVYEWMEKEPAQKC